MKNICLWFILLAIGSAGCISYPEVIPPIQNTAIFRSSFEKTWEAVIDTLAEESIPIETIEKQNGLIITKNVTFAIGQSAEKEIDRIAQKPSVLSGIWQQGVYSLHIHLAATGKNVTKVEITTHIEALEVSTIGTWFNCYSRGVIEQQIFDSLKSKTESPQV